MRVLRKNGTVPAANNGRLFAGKDAVMYVQALNLQLDQAAGTVPNFFFESCPQKTGTATGAVYGSIHCSWALRAPVAVPFLLSAHALFWVVDKAHLGSFLLKAGSA